MAVLSFPPDDGEHPMTSHRPRLTIADLQDLMASRVLVFDGAMGTQLQARNLVAADFGGEALLGCNEHLVLTRPDVIADIHRAYFAAGADFVETNTFGGTPLVLDEYALGDKAHAINEAGRPHRPRRGRHLHRPRVRFVAGSMGPTTRTLSVTGGSRSTSWPITTGAGPGPDQRRRRLLLLETSRTPST
jgi:5-methyltetrahydrofolate--homocysteine methyltransferase